MAHAPKFADDTVNAEADAVSDLFDNGYLRIYTTPKPATADTALTGQTLLAELRFNATAAPAAVEGVLTFNAITSDASANASGTAVWFRALQSDGTTVIMDGTVGTSFTFDAVFPSTTITATDVVPLDSFTLTVSKG